MSSVFPAPTMLAHHGNVAWLVSDVAVPYDAAVAFMEERVAAIRDGQAPQTIWLLEHASLYTGGTGAKPEEISNPYGLPVYQTGRGGRFTWHGPGQRVVYVMMDVKARGGDIRRFVYALEEWVIRTLRYFGIRAERRKGRIGLWVKPDGVNGALQGESKVAAIGLRVRRGVSYHGLSVNVDPDLRYFEGIVPCGLEGYGVTSLEQLGITADYAALDSVLMETFAHVFGA